MTDSLSWQEFGPQAPVRPARPDELLDAALDDCANLSAFLEACAGSQRPLMVLVNDPHRATRTSEALVALVRYARRRGHALPRCQVIVATGTHRFTLGEQAAFERRTFADCGLPIERVDWHDCTAADLRDVAGVRAHPAVADAGCLMAVGSVEPHYFAGLTGAHKTLTIGVLSRADIERNHAGALEPASDLFRLEGNPVYDGIQRVIDGLRADGKRLLAINEVVAGDALVAAAAGDPIETLHRLAPIARHTFAHEILEPADVLHLCVAPPLNRNLYQADKALKNNHLAVRDGGTIILDAECPEGVGPDDFVSLLGAAGTFESARTLVGVRGYRLGDHKAVKLRYLTDPACRGVRVILQTLNIARSVAAACGMDRADTLDDAIGMARAAPSSAGRRGVRVHDAGNVCVAARR